MSLLPSNSTKQEKSLEASIERASGLPVLLRESWGPRRCPDDLLPWLAWAFRVDFWHENLSDEAKRNLIAGAIPWHRRKGTPWAVKHALSMLGIEAIIREWWELETAPHTFAVEIWLGETMGFDAQSLAAIRDAIELTKAERSHLLALTMGVRFEDLQPLIDSAMALDIEVSLREAFPWEVRRFDGSWRFESGNRHFDGLWPCDGSTSCDPTEADGSIQFDQAIDVLGPTETILHGLVDSIDGQRRFDGSWRFDGEARYGVFVQPFDCGGEIFISRKRRFDGSWWLDGGDGTNRLDGRWKYDGQRCNGGELFRFGDQERVEPF